ncbi:unnamed protein product [Lactuca virosa]|uniref:Uncharacterized protein n=1 Tax=Lactuca virosa TaxID=75947 RepID=A0AAU9N1V0_9ASTR|nr:unnamed protein product [Lactuca virosa]
MRCSHFANFVYLPILLHDILLHVVVVINDVVSVASCQFDSESDTDADLVAETVEEGRDMVIVGKETDLLIGMKNEGEQSVNVFAINANIHLPYHHKSVKNLSAVSFNNASTPLQFKLLSLTHLLSANTYRMRHLILLE